MIKTNKLALAMPCLEKQLLPKSASLGIGVANMFMHRNGMKRKACAGFSKPSQKLREMATCPAWNSLKKADYIHFLADREKEANP